MTDKNTSNNENLDFDDMKPDSKTGIRFLIECNCILPQYKNRPDPIWHKFPVFAVINENDEVEEKYAVCNNCGVVHKIVEIGQSKVIKKEFPRNQRTKEDIKMGIPTRLGEILSLYDPDISVWEEVEFIVENEKWGSFIPLKEENIEGKIMGKALFIKSPLLYKIEDFARQEFF